MATSSARAVSRRGRQKDIDPEQIVAAALDCFLASGFAGTRIEDVARQAGVSKGAIYLYFSAKEDLFRAVVRAGIVPRIEQAEAALADFEGSAQELLSSLLHGLLLDFWGSSSSGIPKLMISEARNFPELAEDYFQEVSLRARAFMESILHRGIETGEFREDMDVPYMARTLCAALDQQAILQHSLNEHDPDPLDPVRYVDAVLDLVINGVGAGSEKQPEED